MWQYPSELTRNWNGKINRVTVTRIQWYNDYGNDVNIVYFDTYINRGCDWFVNDLSSYSPVARSVIWLIYFDPWCGRRDLTTYCNDPRQDNASPFHRKGLRAAGTMCFLRVFLWFDFRRVGTKRSSSMYLDYRKV